MGPLAQSSARDRDRDLTQLKFRVFVPLRPGLTWIKPPAPCPVSWAVMARSCQVTPELQYTGINNLELRFRAFLLFGGKSTDFGEKQNSRKL
jgi:hypothetical protein